jgi:hypothetical protein
MKVLNIRFHGKLPVGVTLIHVERRTEVGTEKNGQTDMMKVIKAFIYYANAPHENLRIL